MFNLLNSKEMQIADKQTIDNGTPSILLMERAGKAIFNKVKKYINKEDEVLIICSNGGNGGDGLVFFHNCHFNLSLCLLQLLRRLSDNYRKCQGVRLCCDWLSQSLTPVSKKPVFRKTEPPL